MLESFDIAVVVDALSNMKLDENQIIRIQERVIGMLEATKVENLPVLIRFLLQSSNDSSLANIVSSLRKKLDISSMAREDFLPEINETDDMDIDEGVLSQNAKGKKSKGKGKSKEKPKNRGESIILDALSTGIMFKKGIGKAFISEISKIQNPVCCFY